jgi:hypothetical protein
MTMPGSGAEASLGRGREGGIGLGALHRSLRLISMLFLSLPLLLFMAGWLRLPLAVFFSLVVCVAVLAFVRNCRDPVAPQGEGETRFLPWKSAAGLLPVIVMVMMCGAGGFGPRNWDWVKHDAILSDLVAQSWPVMYATDAGVTGLTYYVAYYLPAAVAGKVGGWGLANAAILLTTLGGAVLAVLWLIALGRGSPLMCGIVFVLFSGMDALGAALLPESSANLRPIFANYHLEWWAAHWQYSSNASLVNFVPHQALAGWLLTALVIDAAQTDSRRLPVIWIVATSLLWSPFVTLGLLPLLLVYVMTRRPSPKAGLKAQLTVANLAGLLTVGLLAAYYASRFGSLALPDRYQVAAARAFRGEFWLMPSQVPPGAFLLQYVLFVACEFLLLWLLLIRTQRGSADRSRTLPLLYAAGATLLVLPWFHYGWYNDLVMRTSIPALFVLQVCTVEALRPPVRRMVVWTIIAILAVGALHSGNLLRMHAQWILYSRRLVILKPQRRVRSLFQMQLFVPPAKNSDFIRQYIGSADSFFFRRLARRSDPASVEVLDRAR